MFRAMLLLAVVGGCSGAASAAEIYRCTGSSGEPAFSQRPCAAATIVTTTPSTSPPADGLRATERAWLAARERRHTPPRQRPPSRSAPTSGQLKKQAYRCRDKRRALQGVNAKMRRGYRPGEGDKLRRRRRAYEDYLKTFCS